MDDFIECSYLPSGYLINKKGDVKTPKNLLLKMQKSNSGYVCFLAKKKSLFLHRALAFAFIDNPENKPQVNHIDGNKLNNDLSNLEWATQSENMFHMYSLGLKKYQPLHYKGKFGVEHNRSKKVICIETGIIYGSMSEAARELHINHSSVSWSIKHKKPIYKMHFEIKE